MPRVAPGEPKRPSAETRQCSEQNAAPAAPGGAEGPGFLAVAGATFDACHPPSVASSQLLHRQVTVSRTVEEDEGGTLLEYPPIHGLRDSLGTCVYETYGAKQAQDWLGHSDPATTSRHYVRLTTAARAKAVAGLDEVTRAAVEPAEERILEDAQPLRDNVVALEQRNHRHLVT
jgi:hypothetical protein